MNAALLSFLGLGLLLGIKHSFDADHLIAVSNILRKVKSLKSAVKVGSSWALGHMLTATVITVLLYIFRTTLLSTVLVHFEKIVGVMLIVLGIISLRDFFMLHSHTHRHGDIIHSHPHIHQKNGSEDHLHKHIFGIGILHGLASNDELLILLTASLGVATLGGILLGLAFFSVGVVVGMVFFSCIFAYPIIKVNSEKIYKYISFLSGSVSLVYGGLILSRLV